MNRILRLGGKGRLQLADTFPCPACSHEMPVGVGDWDNWMSRGRKFIDKIFSDPLRMGSEGKGHCRYSAAELFRKQLDCVRRRRRRGEHLQSSFLPPASSG